MWRPSPTRLPAVQDILNRLLLHTSSPNFPHLNPIIRSLSSSTSSSSSTSYSSDLVRTISDELTKFASATSHSSLNLHQHFSLHFSDVQFNPPFLLEILNNSSSAGRVAVDFFHWLVRNRGFTANDNSLSHIINYLGRRHDFKAIHGLLLDYRLAAGRESISAALDRLVRAGRASQAVHLFDCMERDYEINPDLTALSFLVSSLCSHGFTGHAERAVKRLAKSIFPNEQICYTLIRGYSDELKLEEAKRIMGEITRGGFDLGTPAYNSIIDCVCRLCRKKDPLRLLPEAQKLLLEMESGGIPRDQETFHVLIYNLCKIRKTEDAMKQFREMSQWGCSPGADTYLVLIRSLYQAARLSEAEEMIGFMRSAGFGKSLDRKSYYGFIKTLCGIERVEHAVKVLKKMKSCGHMPGVKTYELLIGKLASHNQVNWANGLFKEATSRGVPVTPKVYMIDPRYVKAKKKKKNEEKMRETLSDKLAKKRKRLKKLRLSFVKKPRSTRRFV